MNRSDTAFRSYQLNIRFIFRSFSDSSLKVDSVFPYVIFMALSSILLIFFTSNLPAGIIYGLRGSEPVPVKLV